MELFRSADMTYIALTMTNEASHVTVRELGKFGRFHVHDLSAADKGAPHKSLLHYKKRVQDCIAMEKRLQALKSMMVDYGISFEEHPINNLHDHHGDVLESCRAEMEPMEKELTESVSFLKENKLAIEKFIERRQVLNAVKGGLIADVVRKTRLGGASGHGDELSMGELSDDDDDYESKSIAVPEIGGVSNDSESFNLRNVLVGTIPTDQQLMFARMLYRVSRGNAFARFKEIKRAVEARVEGDSFAEPRSVFYVVVLGELITQRVKRMCEAFKVNLYTVPPTPEEIRAQIERIRVELADKRDVEVRTENSIQTLLGRWGSNEETATTLIRDWQNAIAVERQVCQTLMKSHFYLTMISLEGYVPTAEIAALKRACKRAVENTGHPPAAIEIDPAGTVVPARPPTYFPVNKFTATFQGIVDTYGVPRYKEANPGLFTVISFPFLFGVMYGDIGHGLALTSFAAALIYYEQPLLELERKRRLGEIPTMAFGGRYVLLLMGLFAVYCGIIYNDCLSIPVNAWGSNYYDAGNSTSEMAWTGSVYPIGVDPAWAHKTNSLAFSNSMKMKMAVTLGVTQMIFGICLSLTNHLYFKDQLAVYFEFIPRMVFMLSTFGYMVFMILYKWCVDWTTASNSPPNLIQTMISMFLSPGSVESSKQLYAGQAGFQGFLLFCAFISVPVMLFAKPYAHKMAHEKKKHAYSFAGSIQSADASIDDEHDDEKGESWNVGVVSSIAASGSGEVDSIDEVHGEFSFADEMIHNAIHTIEFVLGCVSNTASYLRLWALSLAHAQLAEVFWSKMIMQYGVSNNGFMAFAGFAVWFGATFAVLLAMDVLECFLHALRLHWVEFQNKFYMADGEAFEPFRFEDQAELYL